MIKVIYVKLQMEAKILETHLNDGWTIDLVTASKDFIVYIITKPKAKS